jgi:hypothetical protein
VTIGQLVNWSIGHFETTLYSTLLDATQRYSTLLDATWRYSTLLDATRRWLTLLDAAWRCLTLLDAARRFLTLLDTTQRYLTRLDAARRFSTLLDATWRYSAHSEATWFADLFYIIIGHRSNKIQILLDTIFFPYFFCKKCLIIYFWKKLSIKNGVNKFYPPLKKSAAHVCVSVISDF